MMLLAQFIMLATLILMISGKTPLYMTAIIGSTLAAIGAGFPLSGDEEVTVSNLVINSLHPVIADMAGVLLFIGVMEKTGFLNAIIRKIILMGSKIGGGPGIAGAGSAAAGVIGGLTGFTQPAITAVITGPSAIKLGVNPNKVAGIQAHAGHLGNFGGFTHPTLLAVIATAGITFGWINLIGAFVALSIIGISYLRLKREEKSNDIKLTEQEVSSILKDLEEIDNERSFILAIIPFIILVIGFSVGYPVFIVGVVSSILVAIFAKVSLKKAEEMMLEGVRRVAIPLIATLGFLFMSSVIQHVGIVDIMADLFDPLLAYSPVLVMLAVSAVAGLVTQSNAASAAIVIPFLTIVLQYDVSPLAAAAAGAGGCAIMQYYLTGGPVAALATTVPVVPGSELKLANKFQRPSILGGLAVLFFIVLIIG
ncbi:citrate transporter [Salipaludibacillus agaradhaerens]|uniref:Citrate transporter n=1 Tax=Salipaludibacillus agaradhaerens TaxID=76935 RepID=A0A9Q4FYK2_SALAG|nr:SLC13 family permease [Salipaludibacillus agaradhaerens]MCR6097755.1 citrate transporter [Salipaludibacillus agaradhaerens]MCR6112761.1 citrate transporter [Salipaludibacillus agaradhaerens]